MRAIERGEVAEKLFAAVGDDWDVAERARAILARLGLTHIALGLTRWLQLDGRVTEIEPPSLLPEENLDDAANSGFGWLPLWD